MVRQQPTQSTQHDGFDGYNTHLHASGTRVKRGTRIVRVILIVTLLVLSLIGALLGAAWLFGPELARAEVEERLNTLTGRYGYGVTFARFEVRDAHRVVLHQVQITRPEPLRSAAKQPLAQIPQVEVAIDLVEAVLDSPKVTDVALMQPIFYLVRLEDGRTDADPVLRRLMGKANDRSPAPSRSTRARRKPLPETFRVVGGVVQIDDRLDREQLDNPILGGAATRLRSPITQLRDMELTVSLPGGKLSTSTSVELEARAELEEVGGRRTAVDRLTIRLGQVELQGSERWWVESSFSPPFRLRELPGLPHMSASIGGVTLTMPGQVVVSDVTLNAKGLGEPLFEAEHVRAELSELSTDISKLAVREVTLLKPHVRVTTLPGEHTTPRQFLERVLKRKSMPSPQQHQDHVDGTSSNRDRTQTLTRVLQYAPERLIIKEGVLTWTQQRAGAESWVWSFEALRGELVHELLDHRLRVDLTASPATGQEIQLKGTYGYRSEAVDMALRLGQFDWARVVHRLRPEWADMFRAGRIDGTLSIRRDRPAGNVAAALDVTLHDVDFDHAMVSSTTLEGVDASVAGKLQWEPEEGNIRIRQMRLGLEDVAIIEGDVGVYGIGHGDKRAPVDLQRVRLSLSMKPTEAQAIFDAVPRGLRSELDGMRFRGSVGFTFTADIDAKRIRRMKTTSDITLDRFDIVRYNAHANPRRLLRTFEHSTVQPITDYRYTISEDGPYWTPLNRVSPYVVKAIRTNEDGSFYSHKGFHWGSVRHAIEQNIRNRRYVRGASTVSMQLVKNIFLSTEKTIARKLQEALLTFAMEQAEDIPKNRIMEVYLNVIEWGPHVYGIRAAAWHYFRKRPRALKLDEAVFLISILPGPRKYHAFYERGYIGNGWWNRMQRLMEIMVDRRHITEEEYEKAIEKRPWFRRHGPDTPPVATDSEEEELDVPDDIGLDWPDAFDGEPDHYDE